MKPYNPNVKCPKCGSPRPPKGPPTHTMFGGPSRVEPLLAEQGVMRSSNKTLGLKKPEPSLFAGAGGGESGYPPVVSPKNVGHEPRSLLEEIEKCLCFWAPWPSAAAWENAGVTKAYARLLLAACRILAGLVQKLKPPYSSNECAEEPETSDEIVGHVLEAARQKIERALQEAARKEDGK